MNHIEVFHTSAIEVFLSQGQVLIADMKRDFATVVYPNGTIGARFYCDYFGKELVP